MKSLIDTVLLKIRRLDRRLLALAMSLLSMAILGALFFSQKDVLLHWRWDIQWEFLGLAFIIHFVAMLLVALIWADVIAAFGKNIPLIQHLRNYVFSNLAKRIPGTLWYIAGRGYLYQKEGIPVVSVTVASSVEFGITLISGILVTIIFALPQVLADQARSILMAFGLLVCLVLTQPRIIRWLLQKLRVEQQAQLRYRSLLIWLVGYVIVWILGGMIVYAIANSVDSVPMSDLPAIIGSWSLAGVISSSFFFFPSNLGVTEVSLSLLLSRFMPSSTAVFVAVLVRVVITVFEVFWAFIGLLSTRRMKTRVDSIE